MEVEQGRGAARARAWEEKPRDEAVVASEEEAAGRAPGHPVQKEDSQGVQPYLCAKPKELPKSESHLSPHQTTLQLAG